LKDIPLSAKQDDSALLSKEAGGEFKLHFKGNGGEGHVPLTFENSVGLVGTWTGIASSQSLPVSLDSQTVLPGPVNAPRYSDVTTESDAAFEKRVQAFYRAVLAGNSSEAARYVSYPLRVNGNHRRTIKNTAELLAAWNSIFTPAFLARLRNDLPHDMFVHQGMAMLGDGDVWFDAKGAAALNVSE
jgi:TPP-dependent trihydroxycyclohexane-1,2-dione (THcHDO) dehydratase